MVTDVIVDFNLLILMIEVTVANNPIHPQYIGRNLILTLNTQFIFYLFCLWCLTFHWRVCHILYK